MSHVLRALQERAVAHPADPALRDPRTAITYAQLHEAVHALALDLSARGARCIALLADNGLAWALVDLAALAAGIRLVPLPLYFTPAQMRHALASSGADALIADPRAALPGMTGEPLATLAPWCAAGSVLRYARIPTATPVTLPAGTQKITYTSGTTGAPKGVCLSLASMEAVARSLASASQAGPGDVHLSVLPLPTLLENIGGLYAPLLVGATACLWPLEAVGLGGATRIDAGRLLGALDSSGATSVILVPQMLQALVAQIERSAARPEHLRFVAVGGAAVSPRLLQRAQAAGLPVFEGYGLSECASVVALNSPSAQKLGAVGRPLPHLRLSFARDGEILVHGSGFLGYVGDADLPAEGPLATGDLGYLDPDGFLHLTGRKKNLFVTAYGRNVAPEWVERELCEEPAIAQAAVFGEAQPWNAAVIVARGSAEAVDAAIARVNTLLPDYARVGRWINAAEPFGTANQQLTANGRLRRDAILAVYGKALSALYEETTLS